MEEKIRRLNHWRQGNKEPPITIEINPTNQCNLNCKSCWQRAFEVEEDKLEAAEIRQITRQAIKLGVEEFRFPGAGEPLLKPGLFESFELIKRAGKEGQLITNGTLITKDRAKKLVDIGWDGLTISLDSPDRETNNFLRGENAFQKTIKGLKRVREYKSIYESDQPWVAINMVLSNQNYDQLTSMIRLVDEFGVDRLQIQPLTVWGESSRQLKLSQEQRRQFRREAQGALRVADNLGVVTNLSNFYDTDLVERAAEGMEEELKEDMEAYDDPFLSLPCFEPFYNLVVFPDGRTGPCSISGGKDGDSVLEKNLEEIWYCGNIDKVRESLLNHNLLDYCQSCCSAVNLETKRLKRRLSQIKEDEG